MCEGKCRKNSIRLSDGFGKVLVFQQFEPTRYSHEGIETLAKSSHNDLSRRERQLMDILYRLGRATAAQIQAELPDPPSYSAVRAALRVLVDKGHIRHERVSHHYEFWPSVPRAVAQQNAARRLLTTFFDGSATKAMAALLECSDSLSDAEIAELERLVDSAREEGR